MEKNQKKKYHQLTPPRLHYNSTTASALVRAPSDSNRFLRLRAPPPPFFYSPPLSVLQGTMKAAKKRKRINFAGQMLLSPVHDMVQVTLL